MAMRAFAVAVLVLGGAAGPSLAQEWVARMFKEQQHDFGTVARGADIEHRFEVKNIYTHDIELASVRSSCGCTTPSLEGKVLKTWDVGYVIAKFNTRTYTGMHGATLTVEVRWTDDRGIVRRGETQLRVNGNIRGDVVFQPGAVHFANVDQGVPAEQQVQVTYAGRSDWRVVDVRGASDDIEVELTERQRSSGRVVYDLIVRMKDSAPAGYFNEQLVLVTSDQRNARIPLHVAGRVLPQISVAPESLLLGDVVQGEQVSRRVIVRGKKPFRILAIESAADFFDFKTDDQMSERHVVEIIFDSSRATGNVREAIHITTDLGEGLQATFTAYASVVPAEPVAPSIDTGSSANRTDAGDASTARANVVQQ